MCGIAGIARREPGGIFEETLLRMGAALRHRGPDGAGVVTDELVGLAHVRLSILDLANGAQPMPNEDGALHIVYNGEVFNYRELRVELEARGHVFRTRTDTEVVLHGWEEWGAGLLPRLNGQFAFAIADRRSGQVVLARDRFGILPLVYAVHGGDLYFASEAKALFATGEVPAAPDLAGLDQVFTFWAVRAPRTPFQGVAALEPGTWAEWRDGRLTVRRWYQLDFAPDETAAAGDVAALDALLRAAVGDRLLADVPVGGYLSGGLDSSTVCALAAGVSPEMLRTFSVAFDDPKFDESGFQLAVAQATGTAHAVQRIGPAEIGEAFPEVVRHAETPLLRTAPAPLFLLSRLTHDHGIKVVLSGEGADEVFWGYDLFKETLVRLFCLRQPASTVRPRLFDRFYAQDAPGSRGAAFWRNYFLTDPRPGDPLFSHLPRIRAAAWIKGFYAEGFADGLRTGGADPLGELRAELPDAFRHWSPLARAAYLEFRTLLAPYLLSSQGDRMAMAHGVELRVPYLDHRVVEFAARLPERRKLVGLRDKAVLRGLATAVLPPAAAERPKQPYRAPGVSAFFGTGAPEWVGDLLSPAALRATGVFDPKAVAGLERRCRSGAPVGTREDQALVAVVSTELWHRAFFGAGAHAVPPAGALAGAAST
jgi:asparagine synthase (glutamine-hydrolysing)